MVHIKDIIISNVQINMEYLFVKIKSNLLIKINRFCQIIVSYFIYMLIINHYSVNCLYMLFDSFLGDIC